MSNDLVKTTPAITGGLQAPGLAASLSAVVASAFNAPGVSGTLPAVTGTLGDLPVLILDSTFGPVTSSMSMLVGGAWSFDGPVPAVTSELLWANSIDVELPAATLAAIGLAGEIGSVAKSLPAVLVSATMLSSGFASIDAQVPAVLITASGVQNNLGTIAVTLHPITVSVSALTGTASTVSVSLPVITGALSGYATYALTMAVTLPVVRLEAEAVQTLAAAFRTWVLNTRKQALTEYDTFTFNSYATFRGVVLAANTSGLFKLTGQNTDAGSAITATVRTGQTDFATGLNKRVPRLYVGYETGGDLHFTTITSQDGRRTYLLPDNQIRGVQQRRVPVGRGPKSPYWQFEVGNVNGSDFLIEHLDVYPEVSKRRVV